MLNGRKRTAGFLAALSAAAMTGTLLVAGPTFADRVEEAQERAETLFHKAEVASERYNDAKIELKETKQRLRVLNHDLEAQRDKVETLRDDVAQSLVAQFQGQALSSTAQAVLADDSGAFLRQLTTMSGFNDQRAAMMADFAVQVEQLEMRKAAAERELKRIEETERTLAEAKATIDERSAEAEELLDRLKAREAERASRSRTTTTTTQPFANVAVSGRAGAAVSYALDQVGDAYAYGATGADAFDCSGLTMMAWRQAGVSLPHSSSAQMSSGPSVPPGQLAPGDLVFYYSPVSHVGIYIGNGRIVHAANPSTGVQVTGVYSMPFSGAVRPG